MERSVNIRLPDGQVMATEKGWTVLEFFSSFLDKKSLKQIILVKIDGELRDLTSPIVSDCTIEPVSWGDKQALDVLRHTTAHVMAHAVLELFPDARITIGPSIANGFYYDFDIEKGFSPEDLIAIEKKMEEIVRRTLPIKRKTLPIDQARAFWVEKGEQYKVEIIDDLISQGETQVSFYEQGEFVDLCRGPHLNNTSKLGAFKLTSVSGAYWRGDETKQRLQRIYGTAFFDKKELKIYLDMLEEAKKRDHRRLGKELELFSIEDEIGPGLILWHPKGALIRKLIEDFWRDEHLRRGYSLLCTPHIARRDLWKTSGHLDFYFENMYAPMDIDEVEYQLKPMNCPFHIAIYNNRLRSYRELPLRWCELGTVYRYERTGTLHGLMRVRGFTQDDAHIFCTPEQLTSEINEILDLTLYVLRVFGFNRYDIYLSTRPEKYVGTDENWEKATDALKKALESQGLQYTVDPGEGVFYGPKIDIKIRDSLDRSWQCSTIQVDFNLPERFKMHYVAEDSSQKAPIMVHRALMGSLERFFGVLVEHYAGAFPLWLAPVQALVLTVTERGNDWAMEVVSALRNKGFRVASDLRNEKLGKKVREAQLSKIPYMLVVGDKEVEHRLVSPRLRSGENLEPMDLDAFAVFLKEELRKNISSQEVQYS